MGNLIKAAIFDLDGTLLNTLGDLTDATNVALEKYGLPVVTEEEMAHFIGNGVINQFKMASKLDENDPKFKEIIAFYKEYYRNHCCIKTHPYDGIIELINELKKKGIKTAIVSNKPDESVGVLWKKLLSEVDYALGQSSQFKRKPEPDMVLEALRVLNENQVNTIYIGDSDVDVVTAKNANLKCVAVSWGFRTESDLKAAGATTICSTTKELEDILFGS